MELTTHSYLTSPEYTSDMMRGYNGTYEDFINFYYDADPRTPNYDFRHSVYSKQLGGWRWKGIFTYRETFIDILFNSKLKGVDFGGAAGPICKHIDIVDLYEKDYYGREVKYNYLSEVPYKLDYIFSSHTLEHILELDKIIQEMYSCLDESGILALNLPSYTCKRWWAYDGPRIGGKHVHTFKLKKTTTDEQIPNLINIDELLEKKGFKIALAEYSGDNNIIIFAEK